MSSINTVEMQKQIEQIELENIERIERLRIEEEERIELQNIVRIEYQNRISNIQEELRLSMEYNSDLDTVLLNLNKALSEEDPDIIDETGNSFKKHRNLIITAETQNGKTGAMLDIIENAPEWTLSVVSCDNRGDQMEQISGRMSNRRINHLLLSNIATTKSGLLSKRYLKQMKSIFNSEKRLVLVLLNNNTQCSKLSVIVKTLLSEINLIKYQVIHDEADLISKSDINDNITADMTAKVHKTWISHFNDVKVCKNLKFVKRIWVSATPENCSLIHEVKARDVFILPTTPRYRAQSKYSEWKNTILQVRAEARRIKDSGSKEAILYCTSRLNADHEKMGEILSRDIDCPAISYNGKGINIYKRGINTGIHPGPISDALRDLEVDYNGPVIVVGHALMSRGISFISSRRSEKPLSATIMFYEGSETIYAVSIAQRIGRITGTSRPDIKRRKIYCSKSIYKCYRNYLKNQIKIYEALQKEENKDRIVSDILKEDFLDLSEIGRNLDRKELPIANLDYNECSIRTRVNTDSAYESDSNLTVGSNTEYEFDDNKMKSLIKRWVNNENNSAIAMIFRKIYNAPNKRLPSSEVKEYLRNLGKNDSAYNNLYNANHSTKWCSVFESIENNICIRQESSNFVETL
jgi:hypothetical protein